MSSFTLFKLRQCNIICHQLKHVFLCDILQMILHLYTQLTICIYILLEFRFMEFLTFGQIFQHLALFISWCRPYHFLPFKFLSLMGLWFYWSTQLSHNINFQISSKTITGTGFCHQLWDLGFLFFWSF